jgi:RNA polymerase I-specific transcription initiation factor RRN3
MFDPFEIPITQDIPKPAAEAREEEDGDSDSDPDVDELSSVDGGSESEKEEDEIDEEKVALQKEKKRAAVKAMKEKLDGMLLFFFRHLEESMGARRPQTPAAEMAAFNLVSTTSSSGASTPTADIPNPITSALPQLAMARPPPTPAQSLSHFQTLLTLFTRQILPTSSTQHIPFLLFFTSSLTSSHTDLFLGLLVSQALYGTSSAQPSLGSTTLSLAQRIASTVYIGSIVCRAKHVTDEQARQVMVYLLAYVDGKMHQSPKPDDPPLFYAVCQAIMLIFCFRWRALGAGGDGESIVGEMELEEGSVEGEGRWMRDLDVLQRVITSDLNPLLVCSFEQGRESWLTRRAVTQPSLPPLPKSRIRPTSPTASPLSRRISRTPAHPARPTPPEWAPNPDTTRFRTLRHSTRHEMLGRAISIRGWTIISPLIRTTFRGRSGMSSTCIVSGARSR